MLRSFAFFVAGVVVVVGGVLRAPVAAEQPQPNILWIVTDDQRPDSIQAYNRAVYGTDQSPLGYVESPVADRLAAEGTLFVNAFNNSPVCAPSRASLQTGRYPFRTGHYAFEQTHQEPDFIRPTASQILRDAGYTSATFGKADSYIYRWGPGQGFHDAGLWDHRVHFKNELQKEGYGDLFSNTLWGDGWKKIGVGETAHYPDGTFKRHFFQREDGPITEQDKATRAEIEEEFDILRTYTRSFNKLIIGGVNPMPADKTVDARVLDELQSHLAHAGQDYQTVWGKPVTGPDPDKPLLMHFGLHLPHTPVLPPRSVRERFQTKRYALPAFDKQAELAALPPQLRRLYESTQADTMTDAEKQQAIQDYYAFCAHGDALIGEAVADFKAYSTAQGRPWLILYAVGDHGWHLGEQGTMGKFGPWRQSVNNAIIMVSSDKSQVPAGGVYDGIVEYVDMAPTLLQLAGVDVADDAYGYLDGYSLFDVLEERRPKRPYALGEINVIAGPRAYLHSDRFRFSMRTRPFNGLVPADMLGRDVDWGLTAPVQEVDLALYDLKHDPLERRNVAAEPEYRALAALLRDKLGRIVLGDGRIECDWSKPNTYARSNFAAGADDKKLEIPAELIP